MPARRADGLEALLLDAGNVIVFLDMDAVATSVAEVGLQVDAEALRRSEGTAKRAYERQLEKGDSHVGGWRLYMSTLLVEAGLAFDHCQTAVDALERTQREFNLWRRVPEGLTRALERARSLGLRLGVVSNSEGRLEQLFDRVGLGGAFETIVDSAHEGVSKPDPEIFHRALRRMKLRAGATLYAGDIPKVDVDGALGAGLRAALIDPFDFYPDHDRSPRYPSVEALVSALDAD